MKERARLAAQPRSESTGKRKTEERVSSGKRPRTWPTAARKAAAGGGGPLQAAQGIKVHQGLTVPHERVAKLVEDRRLAARHENARVQRARGSREFARRERKRRR